MSTFPMQSWPLPAASFAWSCRAAGGLQSFHLSEVSLVREWMAQQLWTLQIGMLISFFNGCVCTLGSPVPAKLRGDGSQHPRAKISLEKAGTTVCPLPAHYGGNPKSRICQHLPPPQGLHTVEPHQEPASLLLTVEGRSLNLERGVTCPRLSALNLGL